MRICIITGPFLPLPPGPAGAVERLMADLALRFRAKGHQTLLVGKTVAGDSSNSHQVLGFRGYTSTRHNALNLAKDLLYACKVVRRLPAADIWMTNSFWLPVLATLVARGRRTGLVINANRYPKGQYGLYLGAESVVAASTTIAEAICRQTPRIAARVTVVPNPIDTEVFRPVERDYEQGPLQGIYTGRIHPEKGLDLLIQAFREFQRRHPGTLHLRLVGPWRVEAGGGGEHYRRRLLAQAEGLPLTLTEPLYARRELAEVLHKAHFYLYPTIAERGEALPVAPLEAMATGLPILVSDLSCFDDYLQKGVNGYAFDPRGPDAYLKLTAGLENLLEQRRRLPELSSAAAERAARFGYDRIVALYLDHFQALLEKAR